MTSSPNQQQQQQQEQQQQEQQEQQHQEQQQHQQQQTILPPMSSNPNNITATSYSPSPMDTTATTVTTSTTNNNPTAQPPRYPSNPPNSNPNPPHHHHHNSQPPPQPPPPHPQYITGHAPQPPPPPQSHHLSVMQHQHQHHHPLTTIPGPPPPSLHHHHHIPSPTADPHSMGPPPPQTIHPHHIPAPHSHIHSHPHPHPHTGTLPPPVSHHHSHPHPHQHHSIHHVHHTLTPPPPPPQQQSHQVPTTTATTETSPIHNHQSHHHHSYYHEDPILKIRRLETELDNARIEIERLRSRLVESEKERTRQDTPKPQSRYWTPNEHKRFLEALHKFGAKDVRAIASYVGSRNATQVRTHAQKYFLRVAREAKAGSALQAARKRSMSESDLARVGRSVATPPGSPSSRDRDRDRDNDNINENNSISISPSVTPSRLPPPLPNLKRNIHSHNNNMNNSINNNDMDDSSNNSRFDGDDTTAILNDGVVGGNSNANGNKEKSERGFRNNNDVDSGSCASDGGEMEDITMSESNSEGMRKNSQSNERRQKISKQEAKLPNDILSVNHFSRHESTKQKQQQQKPESATNSQIKSTFRSSTGRAASTGNLSSLGTAAPVFSTTTLTSPPTFCQHTEPRGTEAAGSGVIFEGTANNSTNNSNNNYNNSNNNINNSDNPFSGGDNDQNQKRSKDLSNQKVYEKDSLSERNNNSTKNNIANIMLPSIKQSLSTTTAKSNSQVSASKPPVGATSGTADNAGMNLLSLVATNECKMEAESGS